MRPLEPVPTIRRIDTDRADLCALDVVGHLTSADIENAYGLLEAAYAAHDKIDVLVRLAGYDGFDWEGVFSMTTLRGKKHALSRVRRYAVVGAPTWMRTAIGLFTPLTSIESRQFDSAEEAAAWEWLGAKPLEEPV